MRITFIALTFLFLFSIKEICSQQDKYRFEKFITNQEKFPLSINCVIKDRKGFMWFGTDFGLYRFDGYNYKVYTFKFGDSSSLGNNMISCIYDDNNYLWLGTSGGFNRFDKTTERFKRFDLGYINNFIQDICPSAINELWLGTGNGLNKFEITNEKFTSYKNDPDDTFGAFFVNSITALFEDEDEYLWIGTRRNGLYRYDIKNKIFKNYKFNAKDLNSLSNDEISQIIGDRKGNLWIATYGGGLNEFNNSTEKIKRFQHDSLSTNSIINDYIVCMDIDREQKLWIATPKGISIFEPNTNNFTNLKVEDNSKTLSDINYIYCDNEERVWICNADEKGFSIYNKLKWKFDNYNNIPGDNNNIAGNSVTSICEDNQGNFWIGTAKGIDILNRRKEKIRHLEHNPKDLTSLGKNNVQDIYRDRKNFMWIGTWNGPLDRYDPDKKIFTHYYDFDGKDFTTFDIFEDGKENLWVGLYMDGLRVFDINRTLIKKYFYIKKDSTDSTQTQVFKIFEDSKENIWIGTRIGLATIDIKTDSITFYKNNPNDSNSLSGNYVLGINEDQRGVLWLGTNNGINSFDIIKKIFKKYNNIKDGGRDFIFELMKDNRGNFWSTTTARGITMFNLNDRTFTDYGLNDGLQGFTFDIVSHDYKARDGEMFFGRSKGLNSFYPDSIPQNKNIPGIVLTDFRIFNKEVKFDTSIVEKKVIIISYTENFFSFDYAALDYTNPTKNQYAYRLEGVDKDWNNVGNQMTANYTDIEPGEYTFRVKGSNNDGLWNEEGTSVKVIITPPWWKTWWFKSSVTGIVLLTVGIGFKKRISKLKKEKHAQEEFSRKLLKSQEEERKRLANELHDSVAHDILILKNSAVIAMSKTNEEDTKSALNEISEQSSSTLNDVRNISYNLHPQQLESLGLTKAIKSIINKVSKSTDIQFAFEGDIIDKLFTEENELYIYRIVQEAVNNIIKHSIATEASIRIYRTDELVNINISDNGKGFSKVKANAKNSLGLSGIAERVKLLGGSIEIESEESSGTELKITIPLK